VIGSVVGGNTVLQLAGASQRTLLGGTLRMSRIGPQTQLGAAVQLISSAGGPRVRSLGQGVVAVRHDVVAV